MCELQSDFQQEKAQMHHKILAPQYDLQAKKNDRELQKTRENIVR